MKKTTFGIIILLVIAMTFLVGCGYDALKNDAKKESIDTTEGAEDKTLPRVDALVHCDYVHGVEQIVLPIMATLLRMNRQSLPASKT